MTKSRERFSLRTGPEGSEYSCVSNGSGRLFPCGHVPKFDFPRTLAARAETSNTICPGESSPIGAETHISDVACMSIECSSYAASLDLQSLIVLSVLAKAKVLPSGLKATDRTHPWCPLRSILSSCPRFAVVDLRPDTGPSQKAFDSSSSLPPSLKSANVSRMSPQLFQLRNVPEFYGIAASPKASESLAVRAEKCTRDRTKVTLDRRSLLARLCVPEFNGAV